MDINKVIQIVRSLKEETAITNIAGSSSLGYNPETETPPVDKKWFNMYKRCFNCQVDFEADLRIKGLWEEYQNFIHNSDVEGLVAVTHRSK